MEFDDIIGASAGIIHGHPITKSEYKWLTK